DRTPRVEGVLVMESYWASLQSMPIARRGVLRSAATGAAGIALLSAGCGRRGPGEPSGSSAGTASGAGTPRTGGIFQATPLAASPPHLDPQQTTSFYTQTPMTYIMERLLNFKTALMD